MSSRFQTRRPSAESLASTQVEILLWCRRTCVIYSNNGSRIAMFFIRKNDSGWRCRPGRVHHVKGIIDHGKPVLWQINERYSTSGRPLWSWHQGNLHWGWSSCSEREKDEGEDQDSLSNTFTFNLLLPQVTQEDFKKSKENVLYRKQEGTPEGLYM